MKITSQSETMRTVRLIVTVLAVVALVSSSFGSFLLGNELYPPYVVERVLTGLWLGMRIIWMLFITYWYVTIPLILTLASAGGILWRKQGKSWLQILGAMKRPAIVFLSVATLLLAFSLIYPLYRIETAKHRLHLLNQNMNPGLVISTLGLSTFSKTGNGRRGGGPGGVPRIRIRLFYGHNLLMIYREGVLQKVEMDDNVWTP